MALVKRGERKKSICDVAFSKLRGKFFTHLRQAQKRGSIKERVVKEFFINFYDLHRIVQKAFADCGYDIREDFFWNSLRCDDRFDYSKRDSVTILFPAKAMDLAATYNVHNLPVSKKRIVPMKKTATATR